MATPEAELKKAIKKGDRGSVERIIAEGVDVNAILPAKVTALEFALLHEQADVVAALMDLGAQPRLQKNDNLLISVPKFRDIELLRELVRRGADIHAADKEGFTPLHAAALSGFFAGVVFLIEQGADPTVRTKHGDSVLEIAQDSRRRLEQLMPSDVDNAEDQAIAELFTSQIQDILRIDDYMQSAMSPSQLAEVSTKPVSPPSPNTFWDISEHVELRLEIQPFPFQSQSSSRITAFLSRPAEMWEGFDHELFVRVGAEESEGSWVAMEHLGLAEAGTQFHYEAEVQLPHGAASVAVRFSEGNNYFTGVLEPWPIEVT